MWTFFVGCNQNIFLCIRWVVTNTLYLLKYIKKMIEFYQEEAIHDHFTIYYFEKSV